MEEKDRRMLNFVVSIEEAMSIDSAAREAGLSRSDYIRKRLLSPVKTVDFAEKNNQQDPVVLLRELLFGTKRMHEALYQLAEQSKAFTDEQLDAVQAEALQAGIDYLRDLDTHIARNLERVGFGLATE
jgi:hypothetical protein